MEKLDLEYLCGEIGNICGIPIRVYENGKLCFYHSIHNLPKDPIALSLPEILKIDTHIGYYATDYFAYYGIINAYGKKIVIGEVRDTAQSERELRELAFRLDVSADDTEDFIAGMKNVVRMPLESILQVLCAVNYVLNDEKTELRDIVIYDSEQSLLKRRDTPEAKEDVLNDADNAGIDTGGSHNTYELEQNLMSMVRRGDSASLESWIATAPAVRGGILAGNHLRQLRNMFIVSSTLTSRAAIQGGMDAGDALLLSDAFIQRCELLDSPDRITNLQYHMVLDFTDRVNRIRIGKTPTKLSLEVSNYISHHLSETVKAEKIADSLYISRPYLSRKFKAETGMTLTDFILKEKTEEAKRLLCYSDKSLSAIGAYLGFSSQSHFSRVFGKYAGSSPTEYRNKHRK